MAVNIDVIHLIKGEFLGVIQSRVFDKVHKACGEASYDMEAFSINVESVKEDVATGVISPLLTVDDWVEALSNEGIRNIQSYVRMPEGFRKLVENIFPNPTGYSSTGKS